MCDCKYKACTHVQGPHYGTKQAAQLRPGTQAATHTLSASALWAQCACCLAASPAQSGCGRRRQCRQRAACLPSRLMPAAPPHWPGACCPASVHLQVHRCSSVSAALSRLFQRHSYNFQHAQALLSPSPPQHTANASPPCVTVVPGRSRSPPAEHHGVSPGMLGVRVPPTLRQQQHLQRLRDRVEPRTIAWQHAGKLSPIAGKS